MAEPMAVLALILDAAVGWPDALYRRVGHPVGGFARLIARCDRRWNRPDTSDATRRMLGVMTVVLLLGVAGGGAWGLALITEQGFGRWHWVATAILAFPALAQRSLYDHVRPVGQALAAGDLPAARRAVAMIVGRDTRDLDESGVSRAAIESLSESFCDGVVAPLFWLMLLGLPGIWAYKALNTADSLIGHKEAPYTHFGWAAARADDIANFIPARLAGLLIAIAGGRGLATMRRDGRKHASPNAGWPEAAMAGALGVRLAGPVAYDGVVLDKPWIGGEGRDAETRDLARALIIYKNACFLLWIGAGSIAWAL